VHPSCWFRSRYCSLALLTGSNSRLQPKPAAPPSYCFLSRDCLLLC
jgi:hypothetical protein